MSKTVNGIGWQIEMYTKQLGWKPISDSFQTKEEAERAYHLAVHIDDFPKESLRVYEVLEGFNDGE